MEKELDILQLADYSEQIAEGDASAYLIVNQNIPDYHCMFGFTNLPDNFEDVQKLFERIENRARSFGFKNIIGPLNCSTWMNYRWAIDGFDTKLTPDCDNPAYYVDFIKKLGYKELYTYRSAMVKVDNPLYAVGEQSYQEKIQSGFIFEKYNGEDCFTILEQLFDISCDAFSESELYCDIPFDYFKNLYAEKLHALNLVVFLAKTPDKKPIGYVLGYPSQDGKMFVSKSSAVKKEFQKHGFYTALLYLGLKHIKDSGYNETLFHFQCEQRKSFQHFSEQIETNVKRYAIFKKEL
jgi:hypothetical protein